MLSLAAAPYGSKFVDQSEYYGDKLPRERTREPTRTLKKQKAWFTLTLPKSNLIANKENLFKIPFIKWAIFILAASVFRDFNNAKHLMDQKFYVMIYQTRETVFYQALLDTVH